jgi:hypothetical protein
LRRRQRITPTALAAGVATGLALWAQIPVGTAATDPDIALAEKYSPVVRLVAQPEPCGHGEPYDPTDVRSVLGNSDVALRGPWDTTNIVKVAPTARDLEAGLLGYHLDFPFDALSPGCNYEQWSDQISAGVPPTTYAHVARDPDYPGRIALQYWFFYVYNDFNDKHEGDWEMIQLDFDAPDAEAALRTAPTRVGYSQHEGAEAADWGDRKLELVDGTHPVVYPAEGSHANFFSSNLYLGRSAAQGVGCDNTVGPSRQLLPQVAVVPTDRGAYLHEYPWLGFLGRWGEKHSGFYNGPTGPNTKPQWEHPISWSETSWRDSAFAIPAGKSVGTGVADVFCGAVARGSNLLTAIVRNPTPVVVIGGVLLALVIWLASRTRWNLTTPFRLRHRRPWGSLVTTSGRLYRQRPRLFVGIGLLFLPLGVVIAAIQYLVFHATPLSSLVESVGASNAFVAGLALSLGVVLTIFGLTVVQAVTAHAMVELDEQREVAALGAFRLGLHEIPKLLGTLVLAAIVITVLTLTVIGVPLAIWLAVRWSLLAQVIALEDVRPRRALRRSGALVRRHWLRAASITFGLAVFGLLLGPIAGAILLLVTSASFDLVNLIASGIYAVAMPFVAIATTYLYFDLLVRHQLAGRSKATATELPAEI